MSRTASFAEFRGKVIKDNFELVKNSDVAILAVKLTVVEKVVKEAKPVASKDQVATF